MSLEEVRRLAIAAQEAHFAYEEHFFRSFSQRAADGYRFTAAYAEPGRWAVAFRLASRQPIPGTARVDMWGQMADVLATRLAHGAIAECPVILGMVEAHLVRRKDRLHWRGPLIWPRSGKRRIYGAADIVVFDSIAQHDHKARDTFSRQEMAAAADLHGWHFDGKAGSDDGWPEPPEPEAADDAP